MSLPAGVMDELELNYSSFGAEAFVLQFDIQIFKD